MSDDPFISLPADLADAISRIQQVCEATGVVPRSTQHIVFLEFEDGKEALNIDGDTPADIGVYFNRMRETTVSFLAWREQHLVEQEQARAQARARAAAAKRRKKPEGFKWEYHVPTEQWFGYDQGEWVGVIYQSPDGFHASGVQLQLMQDGHLYPTLDEAKQHVELVRLTSKTGTPLVVDMHGNVVQLDESMMETLKAAMVEGRVDLIPTPMIEQP